MRLPALSILTSMALLASTTTLRAQLVGGQWETRFQFFGGAANDSLGHSVAGAGDVDGEGFDDIIIGAYRASPGGLPRAGSAHVYSGATGVLLHQFNGGANDHLGTSVSGAGDVDGDGFDDLIVGAYAATPGGLPRAGSAYDYSGATGSVLWQFDGGAAYYELGWSVAGAGDLDGDGLADLIVGAPSASQGGLSMAGVAYVYSGATGNVLFQFSGVAVGNALGYSVAGAGDVNGDGTPDLIVGAFQANPGGRLEAGSALVYSGADGSLLHRFNGAASGDRLGESVNGAGDVDNDGFDDLIVGAPSTALGGQSHAGSAYVISGATGTLLHEFHGGAGGDLLGRSVAGVGDVDGDGHADIMIGAPGANWLHTGSAFTYSGATGALLHLATGGGSFYELGSAVGGAGDVDNDGLPDLIIGVERAYPGGLSAVGEAYVYSLDPYVYLDTTEISYSGNQPVQLSLDFPASEAAARYAILLSTTGTGPSVFHGLDIPLTQDARFFAMLGNSPLHGTLNTNAQAQLSLRLHNQTPSGAIGLTIYLAAATFDAGTQAGRMSSVVRYLQILP